MLCRWLQAPADTDFWTAEAPRNGSLLRNSELKVEIYSLQMAEGLKIVWRLEVFSVDI